MTSPSDTRAEGPAGADRPPVSQRRLQRAVLVVVPLAALAYAVLVTAPGLDEVGATLGRLRPVFVPAALAGEAVYLLSMAQAYRSTLAAMDVELPLGRTLRAFLSGYGVGQLLPGGGPIGGAVVGQRMIAHGAPRAAAAAAVALTTPLGMMGLALMVSVGLLLATLLGGALTSVLGIAAAAVVVMTAVVAVVLAVVRSPARGHRILDRLEGLMRRVGADLTAWRTSLDQLAETQPSPRGLARVVGWTMLAWVGNAGALWAVFAGLGEPLSLEVLLAGYGVLHLAASVPISPGGLGVVEAGLAGALTALGVAGSTAVTGVIGYRIVSFWLPVGIGLTLYLRGLLRTEHTEAADEEPAGPAES